MDKSVEELSAEIRDLKAVTLDLYQVLKNTVLELEIVKRKVDGKHITKPTDSDTIKLLERIAPGLHERVTRL